jgi:hypothetical protein
VIRTRQPVDRRPRIGTMPSLNWSNSRSSITEALQAIVDVDLDTLALCRADRPFHRRLKTKFGPDVGKFLRVQVTPIQGEKAKSRKASFAEMDLWHASVGPDFD